ncbi:ribosome maturation factor RimP [Peptococcus simiae]|uniref:Ribosome maturation factor RimP n=1 Tax=Peptococcus simiae TaxID=1643805 RepID=A0ABW9GX19_9FIRM
MNATESYIEKHFASLLESYGFELVDVEYRKEGGDYFLRLFCDRLAEDEHIDLNDCEKINRLLGEALDQREDLPIKGAYRLEVSSPGIERPLKKPQDFIRFTGQLVSVKLYKAVDSLKTLVGSLEKADEEGITLVTSSGGSYQLAYTDIAKANLYFEF